MAIQQHICVLLLVIIANGAYGLSLPEFLTNICLCEKDFDCKCCLDTPQLLPIFFNISVPLCLGIRVRSSEVIIDVYGDFGSIKFLNFSINPRIIPKLCLPLPTPPLQLNVCMEISDLFKYIDETLNGDVVQACSNASVALYNFQLLNGRVGCVALSSWRIRYISPFSFEPPNQLQITHVPTETISALTTASLFIPAVASTTTKAPTTSGIWYNNIFNPALSLF